jgi:type IV pilus assembly protein PilM
MAAPTRIFSLNLGMQSVGFAEFHSSADGALTLQQFHTAELLADPGADASRPAQLKAAVQQVASAAGVKSGKINYSLPSQSVFARYLSLPGSTPEELNQVIAFEAQQNVPFPIDEVVWDYQALGTAQSGKLNVVLVAIKTDNLIDINEAVESAGFTPEVIEVAPMALYNAFRYSYGDLTGCSLLVDIGARTTNLVFIEGSKAYSRSIPIGGSTISAAVAKEFNQSIEAAEEIKKEKGFVGLGGMYAEPEDPVVARLSKLARTTLTRLHAEIARSISFYRANQGGSQPLRTILAGGAVRMPYMTEFFSEKLQMPVEFFNPLRNVLISKTADQDALAAQAPALGELVGLALRDIGDCPVEINLRPPSVVKAQNLAKRKPFLIAAALLLFLALGQWYAYFNKAATVKTAVLDVVNEEVSKLDVVAKQFDAAAAEQKRLEGIANPLLVAVAERSIWLRIINELNAKLPADFIWITQMTPLSNGRPIGDAAAGAARAQPGATPGRGGPPRPGSQQQERSGPPAIDAIQVNGLYLDNPKQAVVIDDFVESLQGSDLFNIEDRSSVVKLRSTPDPDKWAYTYSLVIPLKTTIALP